MNLQLFIARRIISANNPAKNKNAGDTADVKSKNQLIGTRPIIRIATFSVALGVAIMIISLAIITGFKSQIRDKVIGFGSHIQITNFDANTSFEPQPIDKNQDFYPSMNSTEGIRHIQIYATKAGIVKTEEEIHGVVLKGIGSDFDWDFFKSKIVEGNTFQVLDSVKSNEIIISKLIAEKLRFSVGDDLLMYFIQHPPRIRKFSVVGIYETGLLEFDQRYIIGDIAHVQKLNDWEPNQIGGFEVLIDDFDDLDEIGDYVYYNVIGAELFSQTIKETNSQIFDWLHLQDMNAIIILVLMVLVSGINMISALLVLILERTNMIGILKSMGAQNWEIRRIFLYIATSLLGKGLLWGNVIGIGLCWLQLKFEIITLDQKEYYISIVPVNLDLFQIGVLNAGTMLVCGIMLIIPTMVIANITPVKSIRFN